MDMVCNPLGRVAMGNVTALLECPSLHEPSPTDVMALLYKRFLRSTHQILAVSARYPGGLEALLQDRTTAATLFGKLMRANGIASHAASGFGEPSHALESVDERPLAVAYFTIPAGDDMAPSVYLIR
jgi:hypothetical protein